MQSRKIFTGILVLIFLGTLVSFLPLPIVHNALRTSYAASGTVVQSDQSATQSGEVTSVSASFGASVTTGDILVAVVNTNCGSCTLPTITISDNQSNSWTSEVTATYSDSYKVQISYATASTTAAVKITESTGSTSAYVGLHIYELSGVQVAGITSSSGSSSSATSLSVTSFSLNALTISGGYSGFGSTTSCSVYTFTASFSGNCVAVVSAAYTSVSEYSTTASGTSTATITSTATAGPFAYAAVSFKLIGCNPSTQVCVTLNPVADSNSESLSASNYFTATLSNGTSFHLYSENASPFVFDSGSNITLSAQSSGSTGSTQWCWASGCPKVQIAVPSSDGSYSYTYYYYQLLGQTLSYSLAPQSPGPISAPYYDYSTAASSAGSSDSPLSVNATLSLTPLSSTYWVLNNTSPNLQTGLQSQNAGYVYLTQQNPLTVTQPNAYLNPISYVSTYIALAPFSLVASCTFSNAGSQPNNYYDVCGTRSTSIALYDSVTAENYGTCGSTFITCTAATSTLYFGEYLMWYTWGGVNGACSNYLSLPLYVNINLTNIVSLGNNYCVGKDVGSNGGIGIYYQPSYSSIGGVQIYALNFQFSKATEVSCSATASTSNVPVAATCPSPYYTGNIYFLGLGSSAYHTTPDTLVANSNYFTNSQFLTVGSDSGQVDDQTLLFAMASQANVLPQLSSYTSPATDNMDGACGGGDGCGSSGYEIIFSQVPTFIVNFAVSGFPSGTTSGSVLAINNIVYSINNLPVTIPIEQGTSITYGYFANAGSYSWYSVSGCGQSLKDNTFSPTSSCTITASYVLPAQTTTNQQAQEATAITNQISAIMVFFIPSLAILFMFLWIGKEIGLTGDSMIIVMILGIGAMIAVGGFISTHQLVPIWIGVLTSIFMMIGFVYQRSNKG